jgi:hypothetical protein
MIKKFPNKLNLDIKTRKKLKDRIIIPQFNIAALDKENTCLEWVGYFDSYGRPSFHLNGQYRLVKHVMYESWFDKVEDGLAVINTCRNLKCVRPDHLKLSHYFYQKTWARGKKKDPKNPRKRLTILVNEKLLLQVFNAIKYGRLKSISEIGRFMNVDDSDVIEYLQNDNWMYINEYYTKEQLDELRAMVMPKEKENQNKFTMRKFLDEYFNNRGCCTT